ncbi:hypothetical protein [Qaidamihabitans albus]|nr:hypothetical protein [Qaidamihabitans albus]
MSSGNPTSARGTPRWPAGKASTFALPDQVELAAALPVDGVSLLRTELM